MGTLRSLLALAVLALTPGCSNTAQSLITGTAPSAAGAAAPAAAEPAPATAIDRALQVAATSARAQKCGYYFDPAKLKAGFLASESLLEPDPAAIAKTEQAYDFTAGRVASQIGSAGTYCDNEKLAEIKRDLTRHLAGDYTPTPKKVVPQQSLWSSAEPPRGREVLNPDFLKDPSAPRTKRIEE